MSPSAESSHVHLVLTGLEPPFTHRQGTIDALPVPYRAAPGVEQVLALGGHGLLDPDDAPIEEDHRHEVAGEDKKEEWIVLKALPLGVEDEPG